MRTERWKCRCHISQKQTAESRGLNPSVLCLICRQCQMNSVANNRDAAMQLRCKSSKHCLAHFCLNAFVSARLLPPPSVMETLRETTADTILSWEECESLGGDWVAGDLPFWGDWLTSGKTCCIHTEMCFCFCNSKAKRSECVHVCGLTIFLLGGAKPAERRSGKY